MCLLPSICRLKRGAAGRTEREAHLEKFGGGVELPDCTPFQNQNLVAVSNGVEPVGYGQNCALDERTPDGGLQKATSFGSGHLSQLRGCKYGWKAGPRQADLNHAVRFAVDGGGCLHIRREPSLAFSDLSADSCSTPLQCHRIVFAVDRFRSRLVTVAHAEEGKVQ